MIGGSSKMRDKKQTFIDPKTGEEIESTWLSRLAPSLFCGLVGCSFNFLILVMLYGYSPDFLFGCIGGFFLWVAVLGPIIIRYENFGKHSLLQKIHNYVAHIEHTYRQQLLKQKLLEAEWAGVSKTALSQAYPTGKPQLTDLSLTRSESQMTEDGGQIHLTEAVEEENRKKGLWQMVKARFTR